MDHALIIMSLEVAERHVSSGERQLVGRRQLVLSLKCAGRDAPREIAQLNKMEHDQMQRISERDRLRELAVISAAQRRAILSSAMTARLREAIRAVFALLKLRSAS